VFWTYAGETRLHSTEALTWPGDGAHTNLDVRFSTAAPNGVAPEVVELVGEVLVDGRYVRPGTRIEAYVGNARCGVASTRRTGSFSGFSLAVVGPDSVPGCERGATVTFRVNGERAAQTVPNQPGQNRSLDLTVL
jgi:hypothetical protein